MSQTGSRSAQDNPEIGVPTSSGSSDPLEESLDELARVADDLVDRLSLEAEEPPAAPATSGESTSRDTLRRTLDELEALVDGGAEAGAKAPAAATRVEADAEATEVMADVEPDVETPDAVAGIDRDGGEDISAHLDTLFGTSPEALRTPAPDEETLEVTPTTATFAEATDVTNEVAPTADAPADSHIEESPVDPFPLEPERPGPDIAARPPTEAAAEPAAPPEIASALRALESTQARRGSARGWLVAACVLLVAAAGVFLLLRGGSTPGGGSEAAGADPQPGPAQVEPMPSVSVSTTFALPPTVEPTPAEVPSGPAVAGESRGAALSEEPTAATPPVERAPEKPAGTLSAPKKPARPGPAKIEATGAPPASSDKAIPSRPARASGSTSSVAATPPRATTPEPASGSGSTSKVVSTPSRASTVKPAAESGPVVVTTPLRPSKSKPSAASGSTVVALPSKAVNRPPVVNSEPATIASDSGSAVVAAPSEPARPPAETKLAESKVAAKLSSPAGGTPRGVVTITPESAIAKSPPQPVIPPFQPPSVIERQEPRSIKGSARGTVVLKVLVSDRGTVVRVVVEEGIPGSEMEAAAVDAVLRWTYRPAMENGHPIRAWTTETFAFD